MCMCESGCVCKRVSVNVNVCVRARVLTRHDLETIHLKHEKTRSFGFGM